MTISAGDTSGSFTIEADEDSERDDETVDLDFSSLPSGVDEGDAFQRHGHYIGRRGCMGEFRGIVV